MVVTIINIQACPTLLETLEAPITPEEEEAFIAYLNDEETRQSASLESLSSSKTEENAASRGSFGSLSVSLNTDGSR
jgi:uncharacterized membrane protein YvbJ